MKKIVVLVAVALLFSTVVSAKSNYSKEVGLKCAECHVKGMKGKNAENMAASPMFKVAFEMNEKMALKDDDPKKDASFKGMKTCVACHKGAKLGK